MTALLLDRDEARRIAIRAQRLDADRPTDLLEPVRQLTFLQLDPTAGRVGRQRTWDLAERVFPVGTVIVRRERRRARRDRRAGRLARAAGRIF